MVSKINDDEKCPCGSGNNYSECHLEILSNHSWRAVKTKEAIKEIRDISEKIREFFDNNSSKIKNKIIYAIDEFAEAINTPSFKIQNATDGNKLHIMIFNNTNLKEVKDSIIAHEYSHILLREEGFPTVLPTNNQYMSLSGMFNNILQDPLIYLRLNEDFDVEEDFLFNVDDFKTWLENHPNLPEEENERLRWILGFARTLLIQKELFGDKDKTEFLSYITGVLRFAKH